MFWPRRHRAESGCAISRRAFADRGAFGPPYSSCSAPFPLPIAAVSPRVRGDSVEAGFWFSDAGSRPRGWLLRRLAVVSRWLPLRLAWAGCVLFRRFGRRDYRPFQHLQPLVDSLKSLLDAPQLLVQPVVVGQHLAPQLFDAPAHFREQKALSPTASRSSRSLRPLRSSSSRSVRPLSSSPTARTSLPTLLMRLISRPVLLPSPRSSR